MRKRLIIIENSKTYLKIVQESVNITDAQKRGDRRVIIDSLAYHVTAFGKWPMRDFYLE